MKDADLSDTTKLDDIKSTLFISTALSDPGNSSDMVAPPVCCGDPNLLSRPVDNKSSRPDYRLVLHLSMGR